MAAGIARVEAEVAEAGEVGGPQTLMEDRGMWPRWWLGA
jgi:hypothetical protein